MENNIHYNRLYLILLKKGLVLFLLLLFSNPASGGTTTLGEILTRIQYTYETTEDMKALFQQETFIRSKNKKEREEGIFYYKKPRRMVWDYQKPKAKKIIINPQKSWLYLPEEKLVYVQDTDNLLKTRIAARFFAGMGNIKEDFTASFANTDKERGNHYILSLIPKERNLGLEELILAIEKESFLIHRLSFADSFGNATTLTFREMKVNNRIDDNFFSFMPPKGVEVIHAR